MESHSYNSTSSSSSSSYYRVAVHQYREGKGKGGTKPKTSSYQSSIHGRAPKPMTKKQPIAPFPRTPPKIYKVEAENFKETVQMLTTAPGFQSNNSRRLQEVAPPPLDLNHRKCSSHNNVLMTEHNIRSETTLHGGDIPPILSPLGDGFSQLWAFSPVGIGPLSPSAFILPSPGTLSCFFG